MSKFRLMADAGYTAPARVSIENLSTGSDSYIWKVDSDVVSDTKECEYLFLNSGRHTIELICTKGSKASKSQQDIYIDAPSNCLVYLLTNYGPLIISLSDETPRHRDNFIELVESSFYDGIKFHRVIDGFIIQAGDPKTKPSPTNNSYKNEIDHEINSELFHHKGAIAAARTPDDINPTKASSGTQFYIVEGRQVTAEAIEDYGYSKLIDYTESQKAQYVQNGGAPQLDGEYTVFGKLLEGYTTLEKISSVDTDGNDMPLEPIIIIKATSIN